MNIVTHSGIAVNDAYVKIVQINGNKEALTAVLMAYIDEQAIQNNLSPAKEMYFTFKPNVTDGAKNFIEQAYIHGKTLPEFANALDA